MLGYDAWGNSDIDLYLNECRNSEKYAQGRWYVLENNGSVISALICYEDLFLLPVNTIGVGSVATKDTERNKGYARFLIEAIVEQSKLSHKKAIFLFADIDVEYYKKIGFSVCPDIVQPHKEKSICMQMDLDEHPLILSETIRYF